MRLKNKIAIVTGGASGFGAGIAEKFIAEGAQVVIADINEPLAQDYANRIGATAKHTDVGSAASMQSLVDATVEKYGTVDVFVNNAGIGHVPTPLESVGEDTFDKLINVNMRSIYHSARSVVPLMKQSQNGGTILNIASTAGVSPRPNLAWYNASKGWAISATKAMAIELAPDNIRVNAINPVAGDTPLLATFMGEDTPETRAKFLASIPMGRFSKPADIAAAATYLCSDEASLVTGVALEVDGGRCI